MRPQHSQDDLLNQSIDDAYILLNFACRQGLVLDNDASQTLIASNTKKEDGVNLNPAEEAAFWGAFSKVIELVKPVTVESIVYTSAKEGHRFLGRLSHGERILRRHLGLAIVTLLALLILQVEWAMGTAIYNDAYQVHDHFMASQTALADAENTAHAVTGTSAATQADDAVSKAKQKMALDGSWHDVSFVRLWWWNRQVASWIPPYDLEIEERGPSTEAGHVKLDEEGLRRIEFTRAELTLNVMSNYFLVTLFALLGAVTHALRELSQRMADVSLTSNDVFRTMTRIILGVISGVCMAWLYIISTDTTSSAAITKSTPLDVISFFGAFAPWALAFISGYSVEIFFAALERLITIITSKVKGYAPSDIEEGPPITPTPPSEKQVEAKTPPKAQSAPQPAPQTLS